MYCTSGTFKGGLQSLIIIFLLVIIEVGIFLSFTDSFEYGGNVFEILSLVLSHKIIKVLGMGSISSRRESFLYVLLIFQVEGYGSFLHLFTGNGKKNVIRIVCVFCMCNSYLPIIRVL